VKGRVIADSSRLPSIHAAMSHTNHAIINRMQQRLHLMPHRLIGDMACGTASTLAWLVQQNLQVENAVGI
jgi:hypothetical protein